MAAALAAVPRPARADADRDKRLSAGEVLVEMVEVAGAPVPEARVEAVIDAPPAQVWRLLQDCRKYTETMPRVEKAVRKEQRGNHQICALTIDTPIPLPDLTSVTDAVLVEGPPRWSRTWTLVGGDYKENRGAWEIEAFGAQGRRARVRYRIVVDPDLAMPGFLQSWAQERTLPDLIERLREEVVKLPPLPAPAPAPPPPAPTPASGQPEAHGEGPAAAGQQ